MEQLYVGLDVSKDETAVCVRSWDGVVLAAYRKPTDPDAISRSLERDLTVIDCIVLETGRMADWLFAELGLRGLPLIEIWRPRFRSSA